MSCPKTLVLCVALSTAFNPFTPKAPSGEELIRSQPGPNGSQLTVGGAGSGAPGRGGTGDGSALGPRGKIADWARGPLTTAGAAGALEEIDAVEGDVNGPVSKVHPDAQPV